MRLLIIMMVALATMGLGAPSVQAVDAGECRFQNLDGRKGWSDLEVKRTIRCATQKYDVNTKKALDVAEHESGFNERAGDSYCGVFQHSRTYWDSRIIAVNRSWPNQRDFSSNCYNPRSNTYAAVKIVKQTGGWDYHWCRFVSYC